MSIEMSKLGAPEVEQGRPMGAVEVQQGRAMGDLVAILDGCHSCGIGDAPAQFPGAGSVYTGGSDYSPELPLNPSNLDAFMGLSDVGVLMDLMDAAAQFPGAGSVYTGGSDYSPALPLSPRGLAAAGVDARAQFPGAGGTYTGGSDYAPQLPLNPSNLAALFGDVEPWFPGAGGTYTGGSDYAQQLQLNPNGLADAEPWFPGAGGNYTGGSDYAQQLPLSPNGLAFGAADAVCDFPSLGSLEHAVLAGGDVEGQLLGKDAPAAPATQEAAQAASKVPAATDTSSAATTAAIASSVATATSAATTPALRAGVATRLSKQAGQLRSLAKQRHAVADKAAAQYADKFRQVAAQDKQVRAMRAKGASAGQLQKLDLERRENAQQAVRWAKFHAVARLAARNADAQAALAKGVSTAIVQGNVGVAGAYAKTFAVIGQKTKQLRLIRARQVQLWSERTRRGAQQRLAARRQRVGKVIAQLQAASQLAPLPEAAQQLAAKAQALAAKLDAALAQSGVAPRARVDEWGLEYMRVGTWLSGLSLAELESTPAPSTVADDVASIVGSVAGAVAHVADAFGSGGGTTSPTITSAPITMPLPTYAPPPPPASATPSWALPVGIGAAGLVAMALFLL